MNDFIEFNESISLGEMQDIYKGLDTNNYAQAGGLGNINGGAALIPQLLENTLRTLSFNENNFRLWNKIDKIKAYSNIEEHSVIDSYGEDMSAFMNEGMAGIDTTSTYRRDFNKVKCMNTTRSVSQFLSMTRTIVNPEVQEVKNGMKYLLGQTETSLFYGNSKLAAGDKEGVEWDGILQKAEKSNTIDLRGKNLEDKHLNRSSEVILNNYGQPTNVYMPIAAATLFSENYYPDQRALMNVNPGTLTAGTTITKFNSVGGTIDFEPDLFMRRGLIPLNPKDKAYGDTAPSAPTLAVATTDDTDGQFEKGTYKYAVVAVNLRGKSVPVESAAQAITDADITKGIKLTITNSANQVFAPEYFIIYRTEVNKDTYYEIGRIGAKSEEKSAETVFVDKNETLPNTAIAIVGDFRSESFVFKQLAPMFKLDYAITAPVKRFGIFLFGTPTIYAPKRFVIIKNINVTR